MVAKHKDWSSFLCRNSAVNASIICRQNNHFTTSTTTEWRFETQINSSISKKITRETKEKKKYQSWQKWLKSSAYDGMILKAV